MSFKQLRASPLLLPATADSFLQVHVGEAGDSKTMLNLVFFPATSMGFGILTAHKICHNHSICLESAEWLAAAFSWWKIGKQRTTAHREGTECIYTDPFTGGFLSDAMNCFIYSSWLLQKHCSLSTSTFKLTVRRPSLQRKWNNSELKNGEKSFLLYPEPIVKYHISCIFKLIIIAGHCF